MNGSPRTRRSRIRTKLIGASIAAVALVGPSAGATIDLNCSLRPCPDLPIMPTCEQLMEMANDPIRCPDPNMGG